MPKNRPPKASRSKKSVAQASPDVASDAEAGIVVSEETDLGGRPPFVVDPTRLERLALIHCTQEEAAAVLGCSEITFKRKLRDPGLREVWKRGQSRGRASLRRLQWRHANGHGSSAVQMTIHLSKHWLGETDTILRDGPLGGDGDFHFTLKIGHVINGNGGPSAATAELSLHKAPDVSGAARSDLRAAGQRGEASSL